MQKNLIRIPVDELNRKEWLELRDTGIGGSDAAAACGKNKYKSPYELYKEKIGEYKEDIDNEAMYFGKVLEEIVAKEFQKRTGKKVWRLNQMLRHPEYEFMIADIDRRIVGEDAILECKTTSAFNEKEWTDDEVPVEYIIQVQHYLAVTGCQKAYFAVLIGGQKFKWYEMDRDDDLIQDIIEMEQAFWNCVENGIEPDVDGSESTTKVLKYIYPPEKVETEVIDLDVNDLELVEEYEAIKEQINQLKTKKESIANKLKNKLGNYECGQIGDTKVFWKTHKKGDTEYRRFSIKRGE
jgi:putative phage-type endonuclease